MRKEKKRKGTSEDLGKIHEFLEFAKSSVQKGLAVKEFDGVCVSFDGYWTGYRVVDEPIKCQIPEDAPLALTELPECARNCWKLLMFRRKPEEVEASVNLLFPLLKSDEIKSFKHNGDVGKLTVHRYDREMRTLAPTNEAAYVIVIYTWGTEERDRLKAKLHSIGFTNIPYRRGCKMFESKFGHWKQWFKEENARYE